MEQAVTLEGGQVERPGRHSRLQFGRCIREFRLGLCLVVVERIQVGHRELWAWGCQFGSTTALPGKSGCIMPGGPAPAGRRSLSTRIHTNSSPFVEGSDSSYSRPWYPQLRQGIRTLIEASETKNSSEDEIFGRIRLLLRIHLLEIFCLWCIPAYFS